MAKDTKKKPAKKATAKPKQEATSKPRRKPAPKGSALAAERARERERLKAQRKRATTEGLEKERARVADAMAKAREEGREVVIPPVKDPERRARCERDPMLFGQTYFKHYMGLAPADYHPELYHDIAMAMLYGRSQAVAAPRGGAKDTVFLICIIWAMVYGHRRWLAYAGATLALAKKKLENIKFEFEENDLLFEDFPEACAPVRALERSPQRARQQKIFDEEASYFSYIKWGQDEIMLGRVKGARCSGATITAATVEGANRGMVRAEHRPDFLCINDGETDEAARSETQRKTIQDTIDQSLSGLAGPGKTIAKFFLCTIVCPKCVSDIYTDPMQKPAWNGKRYKMVEKFPEREDLWEKYMEIWKEGKISGEDPDSRQAHHFYLENREEMDRGAKCSWPDRYIRELGEDGEPKEVSAIQNAYNLRVELGEVAFWSEYQNEPLPENQDTLNLSPKLVASRVGGYTEGVVPATAVKITRGIDVGARELHSVTKAWLANGDSFVVEYSRIPVEAPEGDLRDPDSPVRSALEAAVLAALRLARSEAEDFPLKDTEGEERYVDLTNVDSGFLEETVYTFCKESGPRYRPTKGYGTLQGQKRYAPPKEKQKSRRPMFQCFASRTAKGQIIYHVNADFWKLFTQSRYMQDPETNGSCALWGMEPAKHRIFAKHICAEQFDAAEGKWIKDSAHNHFLDANALADCAGGMVGIRIAALAAAPPRGTEVREEPDEHQPKPVPSKKSGRRVKLPPPMRKRGGARTVKRANSAW